MKVVYKVKPKDTTVKQQLHGHFTQTQISSLSIQTQHTDKHNVMPEQTQKNNQKEQLLSIYAYNHK
jgi:hypothetical protein